MAATVTATPTLDALLRRARKGAVQSSEIAQARRELAELGRFAEAAFHPIQRRVLATMRADRSRTWSPSQLADELGEKLPNVSYHVRYLTAKGFLVLRTTKPRRGAVEHFYGLAER